MQSKYSKNNPSEARESVFWKYVFSRVELNRCLTYTIEDKMELSF